MTFKNHRAVLVKHMHLLMMYMLDSTNPDDVRKIDQELHRLKNEIAAIDDMTECQRYEQRETITYTIESRMKFMR